MHVAPQVRAHLADYIYSSEAPRRSTRKTNSFLKREPSSPVIKLEPLSSSKTAKRLRSGDDNDEETKLQKSPLKKSKTETKQRKSPSKKGKTKRSVDASHQKYAHLGLLPDHLEPGLDREYAFIMSTRHCMY